MSIYYIAFCRRAKLFEKYAFLMIEARQQQRRRLAPRYCTFSLFRSCFGLGRGVTPPRRQCIHGSVCGIVAILASGFSFAAFPPGLSGGFERHPHTCVTSAVAWCLDCQIFAACQDSTNPAILTLEFTSGVAWCLDSEISLFLSEQYYNPAIFTLA